MFSNKLFNSCSLSCCLFFVTTLRATAVSFLRLVFAPLQSTRLLPADCDDIIIADSRSCASSQLQIVMTSSLLLIASSRIYADLPADCDDITADFIITDSRSCASSQLLIVMTSSLMLIASSRIYADDAGLKDERVTPVYLKAGGARVTHVPHLPAGTDSRYGRSG
ncbi:hypothetical protein F511_30316 [Dorcoceras hygrometricum]|uniref:Uncharacterized protein n=1 Tax=Dorcoceras hygrometricum TaxID=472368 RepID=A0A2Z7AAV4_9LAMI|nr:hypothetical protein F511_30316 [Dorcoceras hygrometricum]